MHIYYYICECTSCDPCVCMTQVCVYICILIYMWVYVCMCMLCLIFIILIVNLNEITVMSNQRRRSHCEPMDPIVDGVALFGLHFGSHCERLVFIKFSVYTTDLAQLFLESRWFPILFI